MKIVIEKRLSSDGFAYWALALARALGDEDKANQIMGFIRENGLPGGLQIADGEPDSGLRDPKPYSAASLRLKS